MDTNIAPASTKADPIAEFLALASYLHGWRHIELRDNSHAIQSQDGRTVLRLGPGKDMLMVAKLLTLAPHAAAELAKQRIESAIQQ
jgi:hypothetical protein